MSAYIWGFSTRIFHLFLVMFIIITWISADGDYLQIHSAFGYAIGVLILFRLIWGLMGPKYSHFKDFNFSIKKALAFSKNFFNNHEKHLGHNPAASLILFILLIVILFIVLTGVLALGAQEAKGVFASLNLTSFKELKLFEDIHEIAANTMLVLICAHLAGLLMDWFFHKEEGTLLSIVKGSKNIKGEDAKMNFFQAIIAFLFFVLMLFSLYFTFANLPLLYS